MKIILLTDVAKVGKKYEIRDVADGYALNMLIPNGKAISATKEAVKRIEAMKKQKEGELKIQNDLIVKNLSVLSGVIITIQLKVNEKGHLFAGLHEKDLVEIVKREKGIDLDPASIELDKPIKESGEHSIKIKAGNHIASFILKIEKK